LILKRKSGELFRITKLPRFECYNLDRYQPILFLTYMLTAALFEYISQNRAKGVTDLTIMQDLVAAGWSQTDIEEAFDQLKGRIIEGATAPATVGNAASIFGVLGVFIIIALAIGGGIAGARFLETVNSKKIIPSATEEKQQADLVSMRTSLTFYYVKYEKYPDTLDDLLSEQTSLVKNQKILAKFDYVPTEANQNYRLCITSADGNQSCITKEDDMSGFGDTPTPETTPAE
jgi:hypothetical protein